MAGRILLELLVLVLLIGTALTSVSCVLIGSVKHDNDFVGVGGLILTMGVVMAYTVTHLK